MVSRQKAERLRKEKDSEEEIEDLKDAVDEDKRKLVDMYDRYPGLPVELIQDALGDKVRFDGVLGEMLRRIKDGQVTKSIQTRTVAIGVATRLVQQIAEREMAIAELDETIHKNEIDREIRQAEKENIDELVEQRRTSIRLDTLKLKKEEAELKKEIEQIEQRPKPEQLTKKAPKPSDPIKEMLKQIELETNRITEIAKAKQKLREEYGPEAAELIDELEKQLMYKGITGGDEY